MAASRVELLDEVFKSGCFLEMTVLELDVEVPGDEQLAVKVANTLSMDENQEYKADVDGKEPEWQIASSVNRLLTVASGHFKKPNNSISDFTLGI